MKASNWWQRLWRPLLAVALCAAAHSPTWAFKVDMYAVGNWSAGDCDTNPDDNRPSWPGMAAAWYDRMGVQGHTKTGKFVDGNMNLSRFCTGAGCADSSWIDWPDAAMIAVHGYDYGGGGGGGWGGLMRMKWNGKCGTQFGGLSPNMFVGDHNLKILHASSCVSANDDYLPNLRKSMNNGGAKKLHMFTGFHGCMWISSSYNNDYKQTAIDGQWGGIANSWVKNHYKKFGCAWWDPFNWYKTCTEQCPVAYTIGSSSSAALTRLYYESYGNALAFGSPGGSSWYAWMGYRGCKPACVDHAFNP
ncbi:MAG: hypothetical protein IV092_11435 [Burkholderiaceae bacterium]|nr:hypothetical protein [Burkholderiaceae bacterium]